MTEHLILSLYTILSIIGIISSYIVIKVILKEHNKKPKDILIFSLCLRSLEISIYNTVQYLYNIISDETYGDFNCKVEAYINLSSTLAFLLTIIAMEINKKYTEKQAYLVICSIFTFSYCIIIIIGGFSNITVVESNSYCTYEFTSAVILYFFNPFIFITFVAFTIFATCVKNIKKRNAILYIAFHFISWFPIIITSIYELATNIKMDAGFDIFMNICKEINLICVPIIYGFYKLKNRKKLYRLPNLTIDTKSPAQTNRNLGNRELNSPNIITTTKISPSKKSSNTSPKTSPKTSRESPKTSPSLSIPRVEVKEIPGKVKEVSSKKSPTSTRHQIIIHTPSPHISHSPIRYERKQSFTLEAMSKRINQNIINETKELYPLKEESV